VSRYDVIVVGAGANGLAAAALLGKRGKRVLVLEQREVAGGTMATEEFHPGFRANACRDDAGWVPDALLQELQLVRHGLQWIDVPAGFVGVGSDRPAVATYPDVRRTVEELRAVSATDAAQWHAFTAFVAGAAGFLESAYTIPAPVVHSKAMGDLLRLAGLGRKLRRQGKREMMEILRVVPMPVADLAEEWFEHDATRALLAVAGIRDVMHGPMSGGTALVMLHQQVGLAAGAFGVRRAARGGNGALTSALAAAARAAGVDLRLGATVSTVRVESGRVRGVSLATGEAIDASHVVSSADPRRSFSWVDPAIFDPDLLRAVDNIRMRGATARVHFALDALPRFASGGREISRDALSGTLVMASSVGSVETAYDAAKYGDVPEAPALSVTIPTLVDPSLAPDRRHVLSVTAHHVPFARRGGWTAHAAEALGDQVTALLTAIAPDVRERVVHRWTLTPADIADRYGCTNGSLTHGEIALDQFLFMRPVPQCARHATPLVGFWLCGTGTHPANAAGGGGWLAAGEVMRAK
jgi:phytoene dehydrogenase-like protein